MDNKLIEMIIESRFLVGYLGEKDQANWWGSSFLSESSVAFLEPVFPNTTLLAQYQGVCQAAKRTHDEFIGVGQNYHLYRLPNSIEKTLSRSILNKELIINPFDSCKNIQTATGSLKKYIGQEITKSEGPMAVGDFSDESLFELIGVAISHYSKAFEGDYRSYPYMRASS